MPKMAFKAPILTEKKTLLNIIIHKYITYIPITNYLLPCQSISSIVRQVLDKKVKLGHGEREERTRGRTRKGITGCPPKTKPSLFGKCSFWTLMLKNIGKCHYAL